MMLLFKGILISTGRSGAELRHAAHSVGKNPREASMMSGWVNVVLTFPRYFLITGLTVLALVSSSATNPRDGTNMDFELSPAVRAEPLCAGRAARAC